MLAHPRKMIGPLVSLFLAALLSMLSYPIWLGIFQQAAQDPGTTLALKDQTQLAQWSTLLSFGVMVGLFISTSNLWQGKEPQRSFVIYSLLLSLSLSGFWLMLVYPGVFTFDSMAMWRQATTGDFITWWPPAMAMLIHATLAFGSDPSLFTFIQGFLFIFALLVLLRQCIGHHRLFLLATTVMLVLLPSLWLYPVAVINNVWLATFTMLSAALLLATWTTRQKYQLWLSVGCLAIALLFRHEAIFFVLLPLGTVPLFHPGVLPLHGGNKAALGKILLDGVLICLIALGPAQLVEHTRDIENNKPVAHAFVNQYIGTLVQADPPITAAELAVERQSVDHIFGTGTLDQALDSYQCYDSTQLWTGPHAVFNSTILGQQKDFVLEKVLHTALRHPQAFLKHRICNFSWLLQMHTIAHAWVFNVSNPKYQTSIQRVGITLNSRLPQWRQALYSNLKLSVDEKSITSVLFRYYLFFILAGILLVLGISYRLPAVIVPALFCGIGIISFLIPEGFGATRYLLPSYLFSWVTLFAFIDALIDPLKLRRMFEKVG